MGEVEYAYVDELRIVPWSGVLEWMEQTLNG
jgi:hypothetical protein